MYGVREIYTERELSGGEKKKEKMIFDFSKIDYDGFDIKVNIGSASYWSQLMQVQTMDSFFKNGIIDDAVLYLEHVPEGYVEGKDELIRRLKEKKAEQEQAMSMQNQGMSTVSGNPNPMGQLEAKISGI